MKKKINVKTLLTAILVFFCIALTGTRLAYASESRTVNQERLNSIFEAQIQKMIASSNEINNNSNERISISVSSVTEIENFNGDTFL